MERCRSVIVQWVYKLNVSVVKFWCLIYENCVVIKMICLLEYYFSVNYLFTHVFHNFKVLFCRLFMSSLLVTSCCLWALAVVFCLCCLSVCRARQINLSPMRNTYHAVLHFSNIYATVPSFVVISTKLTKLCCLKHDNLAVLT